MNHWPDKLAPRWALLVLFDRLASEKGLKKRRIAEIALLNKEDQRKKYIYQEYS